MSEEAKKEENKVKVTEVKETSKEAEKVVEVKAETNKEANSKDKDAGVAVAKLDDTESAIIGKEAAPSSEKSDPKAFNKKKKKKDGGQRRQKRSETQEAEYIEKVVQVRRVTKVVKGGIKLSFRVVVIIGNE